MDVFFKILPSVELIMQTLRGRSFSMGLSEPAWKWSLVGWIARHDFDSPKGEGTSPHGRAPALVEPVETCAGKVLTRKRYNARPDFDKSKGEGTSPHGRAPTPVEPVETRAGKVLTRKR